MWPRTDGVQAGTIQSRVPATSSSGASHRLISHYVTVIGVKDAATARNRASALPISGSRIALVVLSHSWHDIYGCCPLTPRSASGIILVLAWTRRPPPPLPSPLQHIGAPNGHVRPFVCRLARKRRRSSTRGFTSGPSDVLSHFHRSVGPMHAEWRHRPRFLQPSRASDHQHLF